MKLLKILRWIGVLQFKICSIGALSFAVLGLIGFPAILLIGYFNEALALNIWDYYKGIWPTVGVFIYTNIIQYGFIFHELLNASWGPFVSNLLVIGIPCLLLAGYLFKKLVRKAIAL